MKINFALKKSLFLLVYPVNYVSLKENINRQISVLAGHTYKKKEYESAKKIAIRASVQNLKHEE